MFCRGLVEWALSVAAAVDGQNTVAVRLSHVAYEDLCEGERAKGIDALLSGLGLDPLALGEARFEVGIKALRVSQAQGSGRTMGLKKNDGGFERKVWDMCRGTRVEALAERFGYSVVF